jgi:hypothetical protein
VLLAWVYHQEAMFRAEQRVISAAADAYKQGRKDALFSEQNLLYMQKNPTD